MTKETSKEIFDNYLKTKEKYEDEGFQFFWIFEATYNNTEQSQELYAKKMIELENRLGAIKLNPPKKMGYFLMCGYLKKKFTEVVDSVKIITVASKTGFSKAHTLYIHKEGTADSKLQIRARFLQEFQRIISDPLVIPNKSCVIMNSEQDHILKDLKGCDETKGGTKMRQRKKLSQVKGQRAVTDYFQSTKSSSVLKPYKKPDEVRMKTYEDIVQNIRGDHVKVLTIPKLHYELDPSSYVSVFLMHEITLRLLEDKSGLELTTHCEDALDRLPDEVWNLAVKQVNRCDDIYLDRFVSDAENDEPGNDDTSSDETSCDESSKEESVAA